MANYVIKVSPTEISKIQAQAAAQTATTKAVEALTSATNAQTAEANVNQTINNAISSATSSASTSATNAANAANIATTSATNAATSASVAVTSATNAANSVIQADTAAAYAHAVSNSIKYATKALLDADLAHAADTPGFVWADPSDNPANNNYINGLYIKQGASGTGSWQKSPYFPPVSDGAISKNGTISAIRKIIAGRLVNLWQGSQPNTMTGFATNNCICTAASPPKGFKTISGSITKCAASASKSFGHFWVKFDNTKVDFTKPLTLSCEAMLAEDSPNTTNVKIETIFHFYDSVGAVLAASTTTTSPALSTTESVRIGTVQLSVPVGTAYVMCGFGTWYDTLPINFYLGDIALFNANVDVTVYDNLTPAFAAITASASVEIKSEISTTVTNILSGQYANLFPYRIPSDSPDMTKPNATITTVAKPANFSSTLSNINKVAIGTSLAYGYWLSKVPDLVNPTGVVSFSIEMMLAEDCINTGLIPELMIFFYNSNNVQTGYRRALISGPLTSTSARFKVENVSIPANTNYAKIGVWVQGQNYNYYVADPYVVNTETIPDVFVPPAKTISLQTLKTVAPKKIYVVCNDLDITGYGRSYSAPIYLDHMIATAADVHFKDAEDKYLFTSTKTNPTSSTVVFNNGLTVDKQDKTLQIVGDKYQTVNIPIKQVSTKASTGASTEPRILVIGDSITYGQLADRYNEGNPFGGLVYWAYIKKLFELDRIDAGNSNSQYNVKLLGQFCYRDIAINYKSVSKTVKASAEGRGGWTLYSYLRHQTQLSPNQTNWDLLGLGNGTHTDYTGTTAQKELLAQTCQSYAGTPANPFFDNSKTGTNRFSIAKWIERYRTVDDTTGQKLTLASSNKGTLVTTQAQIDNYDVCTPTHVIIQLGTNDTALSTITQFIRDLQEIIATIRAELPNAYIGISITPDRPGTLFPALYPEVRDSAMAAGHDTITYPTTQQILSAFGSLDEEANKTYLIPSYFVAPTAYSYNLSEAHLPQDEFGVWTLSKDKVLAPFGIGYTSHPGPYAHANWGYQMYSWIKYTLSL